MKTLDLKCALRFMLTLGGYMKYVIIVLLLAVPALGIYLNFSTKQEGETMQFTIQIDSQVFHGTLLNNDAAKKFYELLPLTISMSELNQNEKYYYLDQKLPTNSYRPGKINMGDLMLFQSDCLVLFYQSFTTNYSYTRLGQVEGDLSFLSDQEEVEVTFTKESIS